MLQICTQCYRDHKGSHVLILGLVFTIQSYWINILSAHYTTKKSFVHSFFFFVIEPDAPTNLHLSNVTEDSALIIWSAPRAQVTGYRLFLTVEGSNPKQLRLPGRLTHYTLLNLQPDTPYKATLHTEKGNVLSEGTTVTFSTCRF